MSSGVDIIGVLFAGGIVSIIILFAIGLISGGSKNIDSVTITGTGSGVNVVDKMVNK